jgi:hypothetical protein
MVGKILQELLADPGLPETYRIGNEDTVVSGQNSAGLFGRVLLKLG